MSTSVPSPSNPWPHRWALALVGATFPLIWVGGLVTTFEAGMAVPDWPSTYGYNLFLYPWQTWLFGPWDLFIEHGHRLLGAAVGMLTIGLLVMIVRSNHARGTQRLAVGALVAVVVQGVLGGLRVLLDAKLLAKLHACTGPVFFALAVALAAVTSPWWLSTVAAELAPAALPRTGIITTALAYLQIVLGAQLRHLTPDVSRGFVQAVLVFHLVTALVLATHAVLLFRQTRRLDRAVRRPASVLLGLIVAQLMIGASTWVVNYGWPVWFANYAWAAGYIIRQESATQAYVTTLHVALGSLILVTSLLVTLRASRAYRVATRGPAWPTTRISGVLA